MQTPTIKKFNGGFYNGIPINNKVSVARTIPSISRQMIPNQRNNMPLAKAIMLAASKHPQGCHNVINNNAMCLSINGTNGRNKPMTMSS